MKGKIVIGLVLGLVLSGCQLIKKHQQGDVVAEVNGQVLRQSDVDAVVANCKTAEDSATMAATYIEQWKENIIFYDKAKKTIGKDPQIEQMVADYQRALYIHAYAEWLVDNEMPRDIEEDSIQAYYATHSNRFILNDPIIRGVFVVVPLDAPRTNDLRKWLQNVVIKSSTGLVDSIDLDVLESLEKYIYQNASGYELFIEQWHPLDEIIVRTQKPKENIERMVRNQNLIELNDSVNTYFLRVTDKHMQGEEMPVEYARPEIERLILEQRKMEFLETIYNL